MNFPAPGLASIIGARSGQTPVCDSHRLTARHATVARGALGGARGDDPYALFQLIQRTRRAGFVQRSGPSSAGTALAPIRNHLISLSHPEAPPPARRPFAGGIVAFPRHDRAAATCASLFFLVCMRAGFLLNIWQ